MTEKNYLIVDKYGTFLSKHSERIRVKIEGKIVEEVPIIHLAAILITSRGVSLSSDVIEICSKNGIDVFFISGNGDIYCRLGGAAPIGTVRTRREQLMSFNDKRGLILGKSFAFGKIMNQINLIKYYGKYRKVADPSLYDLMNQEIQKLEALLKELDQLEGEKIDEIRENILNIEGRAASIYWNTMANLVPEEMEWPGRVGRGAQDPLNSGLNYGYGILYGQIERSILLAGLDPYAGFVHTDRAGKPSLVFDLIEEFRQQVVDRVIFGMVGKGSELKVNAEGLLEDKTRRLIAQKIFDRLEAEERYEGVKHKLKTILLKQAQAIASFVRGDRPVYKPFVGSW